MPKTTKKPEQVSIEIPFDIVTETDLDSAFSRLNIDGTLIYAAILMAGGTVFAADNYVEINVLLFRQQITMPLIKGYISSISGGTNVGLFWTGRLLLDTESGYEFVHYNKSGETQRYKLVLVIERE